MRTGRWRSRLKTAARAVLAAAMVAVGVLHFVRPEPFERIVPTILPAPLALVLLSGAFEIAGGVGLLVLRFRRAAGLGLVALFLAVFPANVNMAIHRISLDDGPPPPDWALWLRLPLQGVLIAWALWVSRHDASWPASGNVTPGTNSGGGGGGS